MQNVQFKQNNKLISLINVINMTIHVICGRNTKVSSCYIATRMTPVHTHDIKYLTNLYLNKDDDLDEIKENIIKIINSNDDEIRILKRKRNQENEAYRETLGNDIKFAQKELYEKEFEEIKEKLNDEEFLSEIIVDDIQSDPNYKLFIDKFNKYFNYDNKQNFEEYYDVVKYTYEISSDTNIDFQDALEVMMINIEDKYIEEYEPDEENAEVLAQMFSQYFVYLLAYHLHNSYELDNNKKKELVHEFIDILVNNDNCKDNYNYELKSNIKVPFLFKFTPLDTYYNRIISSVLFELGDKKVSKSVLKILNKYFGKVNKNDLIKLCRDQTRTYNESNYIALLADNKIHEFAVSFIYYYLKDKPFLASYSPFARYVGEILLHSFNVDHIDDIELTEAIITSNKKVNDNYVVKVRKANEIFELTLKQIDDYEEEIPKKELTKYIFLIQKNGYDMSHFLEIDNFDVMMNKHKYAIINQLALYLINEELDKMPLIERIELLWKLGIELEVLSELEKTYDLIPTLEDLEKDSTIKEYKKENKSLNHTIKELNNKVKVLEKEVHRVKSNTKEIINKEIDEISQSYNYEISQLNKKIAELESEIHLLNEDKNELHKLREYFFSLNNEEIEQIENNYDLTELIKDKSIVIIGGHSHLIKRLKAKYPSIKQASQESHITQDLIKNADYVFIITDFQSHGMYYKAMKYLNNYNIKWDYMNGVNIKKIEREMYLKLIEKM